MKLNFERHFDKGMTIFFLNKYIPDTMKAFLTIICRVISTFPQYNCRTVVLGNLNKSRQPDPKNAKRCLHLFFIS